MTTPTLSLQHPDTISLPTLSLTFPDPDSLAPIYKSWMYETPVDDFHYHLWRRSWLRWYRHLLNPYQQSVMMALFTQWGIYTQNKNTLWYQRQYFPSDFIVDSARKRVGIFVMVKWCKRPGRNFWVFRGYALKHYEAIGRVWREYRETQYLCEIFMKPHPGTPFPTITPMYHWLTVEAEKPLRIFAFDDPEDDTRVDTGDHPDNDITPVSHD